jgi:hypothetical protein
VIAEITTATIPVAIHPKMLIGIFRTIKLTSQQSPAIMHKKVHRIASILSNCVQNNP